MKFIKTYFILFTLILGFLIIGSSFAEDSSNLTDVTQDEVLTIDDTLDIIADDCCGDDMTEESVNETGPITWYVSPDPENPNQVQAPTVQPVINQANPGDTIVLNGTFVHCHFMINKTLNIIATQGTSVGVCLHHTHMMKYGEGPQDNGIFYISPDAAGTVLSGFSFTNDFYYIANNLYNPFGVYVDADDVTLDNLTFNWVGVKSTTSKYDPQDFLFNAIVLNNTKNTSIANILLGNINTFITSANASLINTENISIVQKVKEIAASSISVSNLNIKAGDSSNLQVTLRDAENNAIANRTVSVIINGVSKNVTTDANGIAKLPVKYVAAGTYYAAVVFAGDDDYKASIGTAKISVTKKATALTAVKATLKVKKAKKIKITLKSGKTLIKGKIITIKVNGKTFSAKTNAKGVATISVKVVKKGKFTATVKFVGDKTYHAVTKIVKYTVKK